MTRRFARDNAHAAEQVPLGGHRIAAFYLPPQAAFKNKRETTPRLSLPFLSVIHVVEDPLALFGQTQQIAGQRLDEAFVILPCQIGAQGLVLLLLLG